jgi:hypothetical protein
MITQEQVRNFLRINNIPVDAPDESIREALTAARWDHHDVQCALTVLHTDGVSNTDAPFVNLYTDRAMSPNAISSLLHIDVTLNRIQETPQALDAIRAREEMFQNVCMALASLTIAGGIGFVSMYYLHIGPFY